MTDSQFNFLLPHAPPKDATLVTAEQAEQLLLKQLETHQRPKEQVLWELANLYNEVGRQAEALARVRELLAILESAELKAQCVLRMGQISEKLRNYDAAIQYYSQAMALEPTDSLTWFLIHNNLAYCHNHFGRYAEAEPYARRAIDIEPWRHNAYKNLGVSLEGQGDYLTAAKCFIEAVHMNASDGRALKHLEELAEKHPTVTVDVPNFDEQLKACRAAVQKAREMGDEIMAQWEKQTDAASLPPPP